MTEFIKNPKKKPPFLLPEKPPDFLGLVNLTAEVVQVRALGYNFSLAPWDVQLVRTDVARSAAYKKRALLGLMPLDKAQELKAKIAAGQPAANLIRRAFVTRGPRKPPHVCQEFIGVPSSLRPKLDAMIAERRASSLERHADLLEKIGGVTDDHPFRCDPGILIVGGGEARHHQGGGVRDTTNRIQQLLDSGATWDDITLDKETMLPAVKEREPDPPAPKRRKAAAKPKRKKKS